MAARGRRRRRRKDRAAVNAPQAVPEPAPEPPAPPPVPDSLTIARELWARRIWVAVAIVAAVACGFLVANRQYSVHEAEADILVDTQSSQVVDLGTGPRAAETVPDIEMLATRARLLGNLMASGALKDRIAKSAGVRPELLVVVPPADTIGGTATPVAPAASREVSPAEELRLTLTADETLPILHARAQAPDAATADRLARGAVDELEGYLGTVAASDEIPEARRLVVSDIGVRHAAEVNRGPTATTAAIVVIAILIACCGLIVFVPRIVASWRNAEGRPQEREEAEPRTNGRHPSPVPDRIPHRGGARADAGAAARVGGR